MTTEKKPWEGGAFFVLDKDGNKDDQQLLGDSEPENELGFQTKSRATFASMGISQATLDAIYPLTVGKP